MGKTKLIFATAGFFIFVAFAQAFSEGTSTEQVYNQALQESEVSLGSQPAEQSDSESPDPIAGEEKPVKNVTAIEIKGNKSISSVTVISKMKTRVGAVLNENILSDDLKRLYLLGYFSDIKMDTLDYNDGIKVIVSVEERPIVEKITFTGITRLTLKDETLKKELKTKETQYLDYPNLNEDIQILRKMYEKRGYNQVNIKYEVDVDKDTNKAKVEFGVDEGKKVKIKNIIIDGNNAFSDGRILKLMKTKRAWLFNAGALKEDVLLDDIERIKSFYRREGFMDVVVDYKVENDPKRPMLYINIKIQEGKKYLVGTVTINGNQDISEKEILKKLELILPGKVFSQEAFKQDIANIQSLYFDRGYISCSIQETDALNSDTGRVDVTYSIEENDIAYVNKIKIKGNIKTKDLVIRRELRIKPGDKFDGDKLRRSKERLQNLGFFDELSYDTEDTDTFNKKDLVVEVKEAKTGAFSFGGGYSTVDDFLGFIEVEQKNFDWKNFPYFTGGGQDLKVRASFGTVSSGFDLSFTNPWIFDYPVSFGFDAYKRIHKRESDVGYGYDEDVTGGDLRLGKELSEYVSSSLTYRFDMIDISNVDSSSTGDLKAEEGTNNISSLEFGLSFDNRDNIFDTHKGDIFSGSLQAAGGPFGGNKDFYKFFGRASHYWPLWKKSVVEFRGRLGLGDAFGDSESIPIYERYFAGGAYTIRGYNERKIGPIDAGSDEPLGGESMIVGNIEYTYPVFDFMKAAVFYDTGNVWAKASKIGSGGFKSSYGLGVRVKTPIGPLMLDYGIPLNKEPGKDSKGGGRLHFSVSHGF
jgi:outer membrane protein insertion porin family